MDTNVKFAQECEKVMGVLMDITSSNMMYIKSKYPELWEALLDESNS